MIEWAKSELARIEHDEGGMQDWVDANILELLEILSNQDHSNFTAAYVLNAFDRLSHFLPLTPLTGKDDEWNEVSPGHFQNKRYSAVFKDADGKAYNNEGKIFSNDGGKTWFTNIDSRVYISFPYMPPRHPEKVILNTEVKMNSNLDLISRETLINAKPEFMNEKVVRDTKYQTTKDRVYAKAWNACNSYWLNIIKNALSRRPKNCPLKEEVNNETEPQGEWITVGLEQGALGVIYRIRKCSRCGWEHSLLIPDDYCPKCGMRMKKEVTNK